MSKRKLTQSSGITSGKNVSVKDISGEVAVGEHIYQISLIYNDYRSALEKGKNNEIPETILKNLNEHLSQIEKAESQGIKLTTDAYYALALSAYWKRDFSNAEINLIKANQTDPNNIKVINLLCSIYDMIAAERGRLNQRDVEMNYVRKTESLYPYNLIAESFMLMGYTYSRLYDNTKKIEYLEKSKKRFEIVLELDYADSLLCSGALNGLSVYYKTIGNIDLEIEKLLEAIKLYPNYASAHYCLAQAYERKMKEGSSDELRFKAIEEWKKFILAAPTDPSFSQNDIDKVEKFIQDLQSTQSK